MLGKREEMGHSLAQIPEESPQNRPTGTVYNDEGVLVILYYSRVS